MERIFAERQIGIVPLMIFGLSSIGSVYLGYLFGYNIIIILLAVFFFVICLVFSHMNITVSEDAINIEVGWVIRNKIKISQIKSIGTYDDGLYNDWGVRPTGNGWIYSVSGTSAIEIIMRDGTRYIIGTHKQNELLQAIQIVKKDRISVSIKAE